MMGSDAKIKIAGKEIVGYESIQDGMVPDTIHITVEELQAIKDGLRGNHSPTGKTGITGPRERFTKYWSKRR